jgi:hypothetical protein
MPSTKTPGGGDLNGSKGNYTLHFDKGIPGRACFLVGDALRRQTGASAAVECDNRQQATRDEKEFRHSPVSALPLAMRFHWN